MERVLDLGIARDWSSKYRLLFWHLRNLMWLLGKWAIWIKSLKMAKECQISPPGQMAISAKQPKEPRSWAGLFRRTVKEDNWRFSEDLDGKIKRIQELADGKVIIAEEDIDKARNECRLVLYGKFFGRTPALDLVGSCCHYQGTKKFLYVSILFIGCSHLY
ncbi:hypothetical protein Cni_G28686 [Canna indica]|uniref:Uncharacterized protein n=1 Tax=Canna indica TaxID=4628 RepID=A0AAQ3L3W7_9LILI|nr:hypothetical protein Cni_G28686 [Canna indica]